jgi:5-oxoprolinase (ATP-hydrolysing)
MSIAEQMGVTLEKTASSVNIKERLDFSCALFDAGGNLIANAPHMPVHLGSMGESVRAVLNQHKAAMSPGDAFALNAPYAGGTHLPDITVVMPVFVPGEAAPAFFVASRGHHADVGGISPGSMPPNSKSVDEEGVLFNGERIMRDGVFDEARVLELLNTGAYPARKPSQNVADLKAQIASCMKGAEELLKLCEHAGRNVVLAYMGHVQDNAEEQVRRVIGALDDGTFEHQMDDGATIRVRITVDRKARAATVDFTGTSPQRPTNFNAPRSVTTAAVLYVFRCLIDSDIPLNAGCLRPLKIIVPENSLLSPSYPAAVVAGNVETSQAVTDTLFGALRVMAASQGTMNNFTFGNERHQYYETICGGAGAGLDFDGASAVHTHMTSTAIPFFCAASKSARVRAAAGTTAAATARSAKSSFVRKWTQASSRPGAMWRPSVSTAARRRCAAVTPSVARTAKSTNCRAAPRSRSSPATYLSLKRRAAAATA